ncbi:MAG: signal peptide peptidase SppA [Phycisphaerales bacterium]|nr:MAG: signal peptide peptidase SppA [Phycisphaerales bacterium]
MINPPLARCVALLTLGAALLTAPGCVPDRITLELRPRDPVLRETAVLTDAGTGPSSAKIALIDVRGLIFDAPTPGLIAFGPNPVDELVSRLQRAENDPRIRAVVLRINSPGGTVSGSDTMHREVRRFAKTSGKPVVACMGEVAASGGYYLALAADEIYAQPTTVTGSVGVIMQTFNFSDGMSRIGVSGRAVVSGPNKAIASPFEPAQERHYAILQAMVDEFYIRFRDIVETRREGLSADVLYAYTDGRIFSGEEAARVGLVDATGGVREAFDAAKRLAGVPAARLVQYHAEGGSPRSVYALADDRPEATPNLGAQPTGVTMNMLQLNLGAPGSPGTPGMPGAGFYYLWDPSIPLP